MHFHLDCSNASLSAEKKINERKEKLSSRHEFEWDANTVTSRTLFSHFKTTNLQSSIFAVSKYENSMQTYTISYIIQRFRDLFDLFKYE